MPKSGERNSAFSGKRSEQNSRDFKESASKVAAVGDFFDRKALLLMEAVVERENMTKALLRVEKNKGAAGIDEMRVEDLRSYLTKQWPKIKEQLLEGRYQPKAVRRVEIPKAGGGMRKLGIPTVVDRLIQQALHQVMSPIFERTFSKSSYGFRPNRSAHEAVRQARQYVREGRGWVVDMDLEPALCRTGFLQIPPRDGHPCRQLLVPLIGPMQRLFTLRVSAPCRAHKKRGERFAPLLQDSIQFMTELERYISLKE